MSLTSHPMETTIQMSRRTVMEVTGVDVNVYCAGVYIVHVCGCNCMLGAVCVLLCAVLAVLFVHCALVFL